MPCRSVALGRVAGVTGHHWWGWCDLRGTRSGGLQRVQAPTSGDGACGRARHGLRGAVERADRHGDAQGAACCALCITPPSPGGRSRAGHGIRGCDELTRSRPSASSRRWTTDSEGASPDPEHSLNRRHSWGSSGAGDGADRRLRRVAAVTPRMRCRRAGLGLSAPVVTIGTTSPQPFGHTSRHASKGRVKIPYPANGIPYSQCCRDRHAGAEDGVSERDHPRCHWGTP